MNKRRKIYIAFVWSSLTVLSCLIACTNSPENENGQNESSTQTSVKTKKHTLSVDIDESDSTETDTIEGNDQLITIHDDEPCLDKKFVLNLINQKKKGNLNQLARDVTNLIDKLASNKILSDDEVVRLEFNVQIKQVHFQYLVNDLNYDHQMEYFLVLGTKESGAQLLLVLSEKGEVDNHFRILYTELLGSQYDLPEISIFEQKEKSSIFYTRVESSPGSGISRRHDSFYKFDKSYFGKILQLDCGKNMNGTLQTETKIENIEYTEDYIHVNYFLRAWVCPSFSISIPVESSTAWDNNNVHNCTPEEFLVLLSDSIYISFAPSPEEKRVYTTTYDHEKLDLLVSPHPSEEYAKKLFLLFEHGVLDKSDDTRVSEVIKWMKKRFALTKYRDY